MAKPLIHNCHECGNEIPHDHDSVGVDVACPHCAQTTTLGHQYPYAAQSQCENPWAEDSVEDQLAEAARSAEQHRKEDTVAEGLMMGRTWAVVCAGIVLLFLTYEYGATAFDAGKEELVKEKGGGSLPGLIAIPVLAMILLASVVGAVVYLFLNPFTYLILFSAAAIGALTGYLLSRLEQLPAAARHALILLLSIGATFAVTMQVWVDRWKDEEAVTALHKRMVFWSDSSQPTKELPPTITDLTSDKPNPPARVAPVPPRPKSSQPTEELPSKPNPPTRVTPAASRPKITPAIWQRYVGTYRREPYDNTWHEGSISWVGTNSGGRPVLQWRNRAGAYWELYPVADSLEMMTGRRNPYYGQYEGRAKSFRFTAADEDDLPPLGFHFQTDYFRRLQQSEK